MTVLDEKEIAERVRRTEGLMRMLGDGRADRDATYTLADIVGGSFEDVRYGAIVLRTENESDMFHDRLELLEEVGEQRTLGKETVRKLLGEALMRATSTKMPGTFAERIKSAVEWLADKLACRDLTAWTVVMAIHGFEKLPLSFGAVDFIERDALRERIRALRGEVNDLDEDQLKEETFAVLLVQAEDGDFARKLGGAEIRETVDVLRFFADVMRRMSLPPLLELGEARQTMKSIVTWSAKLALASHRHERYRASFRSGDPMIAQAFARVSDILKNRLASTDIERKLLAAMRVVGQGVASDEPSKVLVGYVSALGTLLCGGDSSAHKLAIRATHVLGGKPDYRQSVFSTIKRVYGTRSRVLHDGELLVDEADLAESRGLCVRVLLRVLTASPFAEMKERKDLETWFDTQLLGGTGP